MYVPVGAEIRRVVIFSARYLAWPSELFFLLSFSFSPGYLRLCE